MFVVVQYINILSQE